jgi:hypothetical protein
MIDPKLLQAELRRPLGMQEYIQLKDVPSEPEHQETGYCGRIESAKLQCYSSSFTGIAWSPSASPQPGLAVSISSVSKSASFPDSSSACFAFLSGRSLAASILAAALRLRIPAAAGAVFLLGWLDVAEAVVTGGVLVAAVPSFPFSRALFSLLNF